MKALIAILVVIVLGLIGITAGVIHFSSYDSVDANIITGTAAAAPPKKVEITKSEVKPVNGETGTSAKDALEDFKNQEPVKETFDSEKVGYTIGYVAKQDTSACQILIENVEQELEDAKTTLKNAEEKLEKANDDLQEVRDDDGATEEQYQDALDKRKEAQDAVDDARESVSAKEEDLMKKRLECY